MVAGLINANPTVYERKERPSRNDITNSDESAVELIDGQEVFDILLTLVSQFCFFFSLQCIERVYISAQKWPEVGNWTDKV